MACAVGLFALAVYVTTLAPGVVAEADTPMFQFVGRVLGVAHNPGYPLYVLLTAPIARLPIGSLPWRINLFSAVCGAVAVALVFMVARRMGCGRASSVLAALGLAFGPIFWSQAVIAEVYTLHAALIAAALLGFLEWSATRSAMAWYLAWGALAAGLAHHTTIVAFIPAAFVYAWLTDRHSPGLRPAGRSVWRTSMLVTTALVLAAGLLPYLFIVVRSNQPGAYLESQARTIGALPGVISARQFQDRVLAFDWSAVLTDRLPALAGGPLLDELTIAGALLSAIGLVSMIQARRAEALLLGLGGAAVFVFALTYDIVDTPVFLIPVVLVLWLFAGVGAERLAAAAGGRASIAIAVLCLALPLRQLAGNYARSDRSHDTATAVMLDRIFDALPSPVRLVHEDFLADRLVQFKRFTDARVSRDAVDLVDRDAGAIGRALDRGLPVFAFDKSARRMRLDGLPVSFEAFRLPAVTLNELLDTVEYGSIVVTAAPAGLAARFAGSGATLDRISASPPPGVSIEAGPLEAAIIKGGRDLIRTSEGVALAAWRPGGRLTHLLVLSAVDGFRASPPAGPLSLYAVGRGTAARVGAPGWQDVAGAFTSGVAVVRVPSAQRLTLRVADDGVLAPRVTDRAGVSVEVNASDGGHTMTFANQGRSDGAALVTLGGIPTRAEAMVDAAGSHAAITGVDVMGLLRRRDRATEVLLMARDDQSLLAGAGWSRVEADDGGGFRWMAAETARLVLPLSQDGSHRLRVQANHVGGGAPATIELAADGSPLGARTLQPGWHAYTWELPRQLDGARIVEVAFVTIGARPSTSSIPGAVAVADLQVLSR